MIGSKIICKKQWGWKMKLIGERIGPCYVRVGTYTFPHISDHVFGIANYPNIKTDNDYVDLSPLFNSAVAAIFFADLRI